MRRPLGRACRQELLRDDLRLWDELRLREELRRFGTFAPFFRASERPMAMACFRLFTFPPCPFLPRRRVPCFRRRIALATLLLAPRLYLRPPDFFRLLFVAMMISRVEHSRLVLVQAGYRAERLHAGRRKSAVSGWP